MPEIILASQSPRRKQLLSEMGIEFSVYPSSFDEHLDDGQNIADVAIELALGKATDVAKTFPNAYVIGSDTIVGIDGRQLEKPIDRNDAEQMLLSYAGKRSEVCTAVAVINLSEGIELADTGSTYVYFKQDSPGVAALRAEYLDSGDWSDKAGGYGIQSGAGPLIDRIEGEYDTVVGLPTKKLAELFKQLGLA